MMLMAIVSASTLVKMAEKAPVAQFNQFLLAVYLRHDLKPVHSVLGLLWKGIASYANMKWLFDGNTYKKDCS